MTTYHEAHAAFYGPEDRPCIERVDWPNEPHSTENTCLLGRFEYAGKVGFDILQLEPDVWTGLSTPDLVAEPVAASIVAYTSTMMTSAGGSPRFSAPALGGISQPFAAITTERYDVPAVDMPAPIPLPASGMMLAGALTVAVLWVAVKNLRAALRSLGGNE